MMAPLTPEQIACAKRERKRYLVSFLAFACAAGLLILSMLYRQPGIMPVARWTYQGTALWVAVTTWRLCRSVGVGIVWTLIATVLAPLFGILELIVLLRVYATRTGLKLTFAMGDKKSEDAAAA